MLSSCILLVVVGYSEAIKCYACIGCSTPSNPIDCSSLGSLFTDSKGCVKFEGSDGKGMFYYII